MTEPQVIEKLQQFKEKLLKIRDERDNARLELSQVQELLTEKENIIAQLQDERTESLKELDNIHNSLDNLQGLYESKNEAYSALRHKAYVAIKNLVENNIEVKESEIESLTKELDQIKSLLNEKDNDLLESRAEVENLREQLQTINDAADDNTEELKRLSDIIKNQENEINNFKENYIEKSVHTDEINKILEDKAKSDEEKQTVLSNTWKTQIKTSQELNDAINKLEESELQKKSLQDDIESLKKTLSDRINDFDKTKTEYENQVKKLEQETKKIDNDTQLEISRLNEKVKSLQSVKLELENTNKELLEKIKKLESTQTKQVEVRQVENSNVSKETIPYKFGSTTESIMQKAKNFVEELYKDSILMNGIYILGNPKEASSVVGLTDKEYTVFMNRFSECLEYNGVPLLYQQNGSWMSNLSKVKLIDYISTVSGR